ncbi:hypothetical protein GW755_02305 [bacterium]|nr:hypothetical protein [bacterium]
MSADDTKPLLKELRLIRQLRLVQLYQHPSKLFWVNFTMGVARGLGTLVGVSVFLALSVYILSFFEWVPFIGEFISEVISYIQGVKTTISY